jgi:hypothetical protein
MVYDTRVALDEFFTTLANQLATSDVSMTLQPADVAQLDTLDTLGGSPGSGGLSTTRYLPLVLLNATTRAYEVVYATAHTLGSPALTIARGKESTVNTAWAAGTLVLSGPLARDMLYAALSTNMPTEPYIGMRVKRHDTGDVVERTKNGVYVPSAGLALAAETGVTFSGGAVAAGNVVLMRTGSISGVTSSTGGLTANFAAAFPNGVISGFVQSTFINAGGGLPVVGALTNTSITAFMVNSDGSRYATATWSFTYVAYGW